MKSRTFLLLTAMLTGCVQFYTQQHLPEVNFGIPFFGREEEPVISEVVEQYGGEEYLIGERQLASDAAIAAYESAISGYVSALVPEDELAPPPEILDVDILAVDPGNPTIVQAEILARIDRRNKEWWYRYHDKRLARWKGHFLFTPDHKFVRARDTALVDVLEEI